MKALSFFLILSAIMFALFGTGCSAERGDLDQEPGQATISGTVYSIEDGRILVVDGIEDVNIPREKWFEQGKRAVYFTVDSETAFEHDGNQVDISFVARGQKVEVHHEGFLAESYPEQGRALKVVIADPAAAEKAYIDSGRHIGTVEKDGTEFLKVHISGTPEEIPARLFRMTEQAWAVYENLNLEPEEVIIFRYLADNQSEGLIFDLSRLIN